MKMESKFAQLRYQLRFAHLGRACTLAAAALAGTATAGEPVSPVAGTPTGLPAVEGAGQPASPAAIETAQTPQTQDAGRTASFGGETVRAVDLGQLEGQRGRADTVLNDTKLNGDVANNSAVNVQTGSNTIDAGSFANMSGIPVVIQNSGANVLIQNATVVNLQFQ